MVTDLEVSDAELKAELDSQQANIDILENSLATASAAKTRADAGLAEAKRGHNEVIMTLREELTTVKARYQLEVIFQL
jgi:hypothetical protein